MKFCPKCGTRPNYILDKENPRLQCPKCGYIEAGDANMIEPVEVEMHISDIPVIGERDPRQRSPEDKEKDCMKEIRRANMYPGIERSGGY